MKGEAGEGEGAQVGDEELSLPLEAHRTIAPERTTSDARGRSSRTREDVEVALTLRTAEL